MGTGMLFFPAPLDLEQFLQTTILQVHTLVQWRLGFARNLYLWKNYYLYLVFASTSLC